MGALIDKFCSDEELERRLRERGHTCITSLEIQPPRLDWCRQKPCVNSRNNGKKLDDEELEEKLKEQGHTCIEYLETWPPMIRWCGQTPCVNDTLSIKTPGE